MQCIWESPWDSYVPSGLGSLVLAIYLIWGYLEMLDNLLQAGAAKNTLHRLCNTILAGPLLILDSSGHLFTISDRAAAREHGTLVAVV